MQIKQKIRKNSKKLFAMSAAVLMGLSLFTGYSVNNKSVSALEDNTKPVLSINVVGKGDVTVNTDLKYNQQFLVSQISPLNNEFDEGSKLDIEVKTDNEIDEIYVGDEELDGDYQGKQEYSFSYTTTDKDEQIYIGFAEPDPNYSSDGAISTASASDTTISDVTGKELDGEEIANLAMQWVGKIQYGHYSNPRDGMDCAGFVTMVYKKALGTLDWNPWGDVNGSYSGHYAQGGLYGENNWNTTDAYGILVPGMMNVEKWVDYLNTHQVTASQAYTSSDCSSVNFDDYFNVGDIVVYYFDTGGTNLGNSASGLMPHMGIYCGNNQVVQSTVNPTIGANGVVVASLDASMLKGQNTLQSFRIYKASQKEWKGEINLNKTFDGESSATTSFSTSNTYIKDEYKDFVNSDSEAGKDAKKTYKIVTPSKTESSTTEESNKDSTNESEKDEVKTDTSDITVELDDNGNKSTIKWSEFTTTEKTETSVQGNVTFTVTADCDVVGKTGKTLITKGTVVNFEKKESSFSYSANSGTSKITLTNGKTLEIKDLPVQKGTTTYIVQEQTTYENYVLDTKEYTFTFECAGTEDSDYEFLPKEQTDGIFTIDNESIKIHTTATNAEVEDGKEINNSSIVKLTDKVAYSGLTVGKEYKVTGTLMNKDTGLPVLDSEGKQVTGETTFTAETTEGTVNVDFVFDASALGGSQVVVYENLYNLETGSIIAQHEDIEDEDQTVDVNEVLIHTTATVNDSHQAEAKGNITLKDKVYFDNLTEGMEYTVTGVLMDKTTGQPLLVNGKEVTASNTFTAKGSKNGYTTVEFNFDATGLEGKDLVVFETCTHTVVTTDEDGNEKKEETTVAEHKDINDTDQTISFAPKTGTGTDETPYIACGAGAVAILAVVLVLTKKKKN